MQKQRKLWRQRFKIGCKAFQSHYKFKEDFLDYVSTTKMSRI
jgi:hypothetical protein